MRALLFACRWLSSHYVHTWLFIGVCWGGGCPLWVPTLLDQGPTFMTSFNFNSFLVSPENIATLGLQHMNCWGRQGGRTTNIQFIMPSVSSATLFILTKWLIGAFTLNFYNAYFCYVLSDAMHCFLLLFLCRHMPWHSSNLHFSTYSLPFLHTGPYKQLFHVYLLVGWLVD